MLIPHVSSKIICSLNPICSNAPTIFNWAIHTVAEVNCSVVPVEGLLCLEGSGPRTIRGFASKFPWGAGMRATVEVMGNYYYDTGRRIRVLSKRKLLTCYQSTCGIGRRSWEEWDGHPLEGLWRGQESEGCFSGFCCLLDWLDWDYR